MASFAEKLKLLRELNGMTQAALADRLNVARSTVAGYETRSRQPSHEKLTVMADLFHVSIDYLLDDSKIELTSFDNTYSSQREKLLIARYRKLSSESQKDLLHFLDMLETWDSRQH